MLTPADTPPHPTTTHPDRFPDGEINPTLAFDGCYTIYELFRRSVAIYPNRPFLGHRPIDSEVRLRVRLALSSRHLP